MANFLNRSKQGGSVKHWMSFQSEGVEPMMLESGHTCLCLVVGGTCEGEKCQCFSTLEACTSKCCPSCRAQSKKMPDFLIESGGSQDNLPFDMVESKIEKVVEKADRKKKGCSCENTRC